jgi:hypothetical protein
MISKYKNIIIIGIVLIIGFVIYSLTRPDPEALTSLNSVSVQSRDEILGQVILRALGQVNALTLDKSILEDPVVKSLRDKSTIIPPVNNPGRSNPFAPFGQGGQNIGNPVPPPNLPESETENALIN